MVGGSLVLAAFGFLFYRIWLVMYRADDPYYRMLAAGVLGMLAFHTFVNLFMVTQMLPVIGLWLPFFSYGGTAMWLCMSAVRPRGQYPFARKTNPVLNGDQYGWLYFA